MIGPRIVAVVPARMSSTRFPGKPLCPLGGVPMIERVCRMVARSPEVTQVLVATEDEAIFTFCRRRGLPVQMTGRHPSGTDRVAEVALSLAGDLFVNVQGDQPLFDPRQMRALLTTVARHPETSVATVVAPLPEGEATSPHRVKVALAADGRALYFSRALIPHGTLGPGQRRWQHVGLYAYTREALAAFRRQGPSPLERLESLEQLRFLEAGVPIQTSVTEIVTPSVDTPEDAATVERRLAHHDDLRADALPEPPR